jgi:hypothetical protein
MEEEKKEPKKEPWLRRITNRYEENHPQLIAIIKYLYGIK